MSITSHITIFVQALTNVCQAIVIVTIANVRVTSKMIKFYPFKIFLFIDFFQNPDI